MIDKNDKRRIRVAIVAAIPPDGGEISQWNMDRIKAQFGINSEELGGVMRKLRIKKKNKGRR